MLGKGLDLVVERRVELADDLLLPVITDESEQHLGSVNAILKTESIREQSARLTPETLTIVRSA